MNGCNDFYETVLVELPAIIYNNNRQESCMYNKNGQKN
jgi:hypothetical protein